MASGVGAVTPGGGEQTSQGILAVLNHVFTWVF